MAQGVKWDLDAVVAMAQTPTDECVDWPGSCNPGGYGRFRVDDRRVTVHRWVYEQLNGPIEPGLFVCHRCDRPRCFNARHLFLGTPQDNAVDMVRKGRGVDNRGERHGLAKLTDAQAREILRRATADPRTETFAQIGAEFNVSKITVAHIVHGRRWRHAA